MPYPLLEAYYFKELWLLMLSCLENASLRLNHGAIEDVLGRSIFSSTYSSSRSKPSLAKFALKLNNLQSITNVEMF